MADYIVSNCTIQINGASDKEEVFAKIQEMLNSFEEMNDSNVSIVISNFDWDKNVRRV